jgi:glycosyltransferase involved in cell wall biosynthesis
MRVTVVTSLFPSPPRPREGIFALERWRRFQLRGHDVRVVHPQPRTPPLARGAWAEIAAMPQQEEREGLPVQRPRYWHLPRRPLGNAKRFASAALPLLNSAEVVVCDYAWPASALAPLTNLPCVVNGRGSDVLQVAGEAGLAEPLASNLRAAGRWCAVSQDLVETMDRLAGCPGVGRLVPNGVDGELFRPRERAECRRALELEPDGPLVAVVGHLIPRKDPLLALESFRLGAPQGARIVFAGRGVLDDELRAAAGADLGTRVRLLGERKPEQLAQVYGACDLLLLTSTREGRPNVVLEALASGRPVLATRAGGTAELIDDPRCLSASRDPAELGKMLAHLLSDPPLPETLTARVSHLTWDASLDALEALLEEART